MRHRVDDHSVLLQLIHGYSNQQGDYNTRFAKAAHNPFKAHRALLSTEVLDEIFTWQETRKLSHSLTFNYQRQLFLVRETEEIRLLAGQRVTVVELSDGTVQVGHGGKLLPLTRFGKDDAEIAKGAIVSNELLAGALQFIKDELSAPSERERAALGRPLQRPASRGTERLESSVNADFRAPAMALTVPDHLHLGPWANDLQRSG